MCSYTLSVTSRPPTGRIITTQSIPNNKTRRFISMGRQIIEFIYLSESCGHNFAVTSDNLQHSATPCKNMSLSKDHFLYHENYFWSCLRPAEQRDAEKFGCKTNWPLLIFSTKRVHWLLLSIVIAIKVFVSTILFWFDDNYWEFNFF